ncbi:MAG: 4-hydroxythreonine-4-phosphate dehydrogenase PdxA [Candidatus Omnitrophica bacterium]|nr:4-hydroxythreonine-4-phosphate dehydrogenase PdxA [Candidatus Omnitrophota bacterium]
MPTSPSNKPVAAITMGDPSGIGPEIILKSLSKPDIRRLATYIVVGDLKTLRRSSAALSAPCKSLLKKIHVISGGSISNKEDLTAVGDRVMLLDLANIPPGDHSFGKERAAYGKASVEYIKRGYGLIRAGIADCIVTAPINKASAKKSGFRFPGHTEYFITSSGAKRAAMMLIGGPLRVSLVTRHIPISSISGKLSSDSIEKTIDITLQALKRDFNIARPRIGVCGLNPHSGEGGMFGKEELSAIAPAVSRYKRSNITGPLPADSIFYYAYRGKYDAVICMYHDQGLIPLKMIARDTGVNVTLGLDFVRTSPDHGTAFDIAGKGDADPRSMEEAIKLAVAMCNNRRVNA